MSSLKEKTEAALERRIEIHEGIVRAMAHTKWGKGFRKPGSLNPKKGKRVRAGSRKY